MSRFELGLKASDVPFVSVGMGMGMTVHCDVCSRPLGSTAGCTRPKPLRLLHCPACTEARAQRRAKHMGPVVEVLLLQLGAELPHDGHVQRWLGRADAHVLAWQALAHLRCNRRRDRHDSHVKVRNHLIVSLVMEHSEERDGHLIWLGGMMRGQPRFTPGTETTSLYLRGPFWTATKHRSVPGGGVQPACGDMRCMSCLKKAPRHAGRHCGGIRTIEDIKNRCAVLPCGCWRWKLHVNREGKPVLCYADPGNGKLVRSFNGRRAALHLARGRAVPRTHWAQPIETCAFADCMNPEHTVSIPIGDHALFDEGSEKLQSLRASAVKRRRLTPEQAVAVKRRLLAGETKAALAREFGVSAKTIHKVERGERKCDVAAQAITGAAVVASSPFRLGQSLAVELAEAA